MRGWSFVLVLFATACGGSKEAEDGDADTPTRDAATRDTGPPIDGSTPTPTPPTPPGPPTPPTPPPPVPPPPPTDGGAPPEDMSLPATDAGPSPTGSEALAGYWVWKQTVEGGAVTQEITEADLAWMVGPTGWAGCPDGISCTHFGIHSVGFAEDSDHAHYAHRVVTGSDTQHPGLYSVDGDLLTFMRTETFSCAHPPGGSAADARTYHARFRRMGDDLWLSVGGFGGIPFSTDVPPAEPDRWIVYRPITQSEFHGRYDHPYCGAMRKGVESCHPLCASADVLGTGSP